MFNLFLTRSLLLILTTGINGVIIKDCGSVYGELKSVNLTNCTEDMTECVLKLGTTVTLSIDFLTKANITEIAVNVQSLVVGVAFPFQTPNPDGCKNSGLVCPLAADTNVIYTGTFIVPSSYPRVRAHLKWVLQNEEPIICLLIPIRVV